MCKAINERRNYILNGVLLKDKAEMLELEDAQTDFPTRPQAKPAPEAYPLGYVEDADETRTQLEVCFSIPLS